MNLNVVRALFADALAQILDNRVFRILCVLIGIPILMTFLIGFKETEITFLFGWKTITYDDLISFFTGSRLGGVDPREATIQFFQELIVTELAGRLGLMLSISATASIASASSMTISPARYTAATRCASWNICCNAHGRGARRVLRLSGWPHPITCSPRRFMRASSAFPAPA